MNCFAMWHFMPSMLRTRLSSGSCLPCAKHTQPQATQRRNLFRRNRRQATQRSNSLRRNPLSVSMRRHLLRRNRRQAAQRRNSLRRNPSNSVMRYYSLRLRRVPLNISTHCNSLRRTGRNSHLRFLLFSAIRKPFSAIFLLCSDRLLLCPTAFLRQKYAFLP